MTPTDISYFYQTAIGELFPLYSGTLEEATNEVRDHYFSRTNAVAIVEQTRKVVAAFDGREL